MKYLFAVAAVAALALNAPPLGAKMITVGPSACESLSTHTASDDVAYKPGVDADDAENLALGLGHPFITGADDLVDGAGLASIGPAAQTLAEAEGLDAHALSVALRLKGGGGK